MKFWNSKGLMILDEQRKVRVYIWVPRDLGIVDNNGIG